MRSWFIAAAIAGAAISGVALAAVEARRPNPSVAIEAPISILELTLKAPQLPVQEVEDFSFVYTKREWRDNRFTLRALP
jgi:hypothetical protein